MFHIDKYAIVLIQSFIQRPPYAQLYYGRKSACWRQATGGWPHWSSPGGRTTQEWQWSAMVTIPHLTMHYIQYHAQFKVLYRLLVTVGNITMQLQYAKDWHFSPIVTIPIHTSHHTLGITCSTIPTFQWNFHTLPFTTFSLLLSGGIGEPCEWCVVEITFVERFKEFEGLRNWSN